MLFTFKKRVKMKYVAYILKCKELCKNSLTQIGQCKVKPIIKLAFC